MKLPNIFARFTKSEPVPTKRPGRKIGFFDLLHSKKSAPSKEVQKVVVPKFNLSFQSGIVHPQTPLNSVFTFRNMAREAEEVLLWRSVIQALIDTLKINPIETVKVDGVDEINPMEEAYLKDFLQKANQFGQTLDDIEMEWQQDCHEVNNGWFWVIKEYFYQGGVVYGQKPKGGIVTEAYRGDPALFRWSYTEDFEPYWVRCPVHVEQVQDYKAGDVQLCPDCGAVMFPVKVVCTKTEGGTDVENYYIDGEVYHTGRFHSGRGGLLYFTPPLVSFIYELLTWTELRNHKAGALIDKKAPDGILAATGSNPDEMHDWLDEAMLRMEEKDYRYIPFLTIRSDGKASGVQYINLLGDLLTQFPEIEKEIRNRICGYYGVAPAFIADIKDIGGLHSDEKQIPITQMKGEGSLNLSNRGLFPWLVKQMGMATVTIEKASVWQEGENQRIDTQSKQADLAQKHINMGGTVEFDGSDYVLSKGTLTPAVESNWPISTETNLQFNGDRPGDGTGGMDRIPMPSNRECPPGYHPSRRGDECVKECLSAPSTPKLHNSDPSPIKQELESFMESKKAKATTAEKPRSVSEINRDLRKGEAEYIEGLMDAYLDRVQKFYWAKERKPTQKELAELVGGLITEIQKDWKTITDREMEDIFKLYMELAHAEEGLPLGPWRQSYEEAAQAYLNDAKGIKGFLKNYGTKTQDQIMFSVADHMKRDIFDRDEFVRDLRKVATDATEARIQTMANTEFTHAVDLARKTAWETIEKSQGETLYVEWYGPLECPICKQIAKTIKAKGGCIPMKKLRGTVKTVAKSSKSKTAVRGWRPHPNCKCSITRCFK